MTNREIKTGIYSAGAIDLEPVIVKGFPSEEDLKALDILADNIFKKHREHNII